MFHGHSVLRVSPGYYRNHRNRMIRNAKLRQVQAGYQNVTRWSKSTKQYKQKPPQTPTKHYKERNSMKENLHWHACSDTQTPAPGGGPGSARHGVPHLDSRTCTIRTCPRARYLPSTSSANCNQSVLQARMPFPRAQLAH
jgi:hypothetical protein